MQPFDITLNALHEFTVEKSKNLSQRNILLKLDMVDGKKVLRAVPETEFTGFERIKAFFGCSSFNLSYIVTFLQNDFCSQLDAAPLQKQQYDEICTATKYLDVNIITHNNRFWLSRSTIRTKEANLEKTVTPHAPPQDEKVVSVAETLTKKANLEKTVTPRVPPQDEQVLDKVLDRVLGEAESLTGLFETKLMQALKEGRVAINEKGEFDHSKVDPLFDQQWQECILQLSQEGQSLAQATLNKTINRAMIQQEIQHLERKIASKPNMVEQILLEKYCVIKKKPYPSTESIDQAEIKALRDLEGDKAALSNTLPSNMKKQTEGIKKQALLGLCGIPKEDCHRWHEMIELYDKEWKGLLEYSESKIPELTRDVLSQDLPRIATDYLAKGIKDYSQSCSEDVMRLIISDTINKISDPQIKPKDLEDRLNKQRPSYYKRFDKEMEPLHKEIQVRSEFYKKWQPYLTAEMMQGFYDPEEDLGDGVCHALALRWVATELKKNPLNDSEDIIQALKIGSISPKDRMVQASKGIGKNDIPRIQERLGLEKTVSHSVLNLKSKEEIAKAVKDLCQNNDFLSTGVALLGFGWGEGHGHAIAVRFERNEADPANSVYRISDANYGTFNFKPKPPDFSEGKCEQQFRECLSDLLSVYNEKIKLFWECFELKK